MTKPSLDTSGNKGTPKVALVAGPDVSGRIELMRYLKGDSQIFALGSDHTLGECFAQAGFRYLHYHLVRRVNPGADIHILAELHRIFRQEVPDIVHAFDTKPCVYARLAARMAGVPVVVGTLPGLGSLYVDNGLGTRVIRAAYERLQKLACHLSDLTIFQNEEDAGQFIERGIIPESKVAVVPGSGVQTDQFDPAGVSQSERERVRAAIGIPPDALVITMIARLIRSKGVLEFAKAAGIVSNHPENVRFLLVGPTDKESVDRLSRQELSHVTQSVTWLGERRDIPHILCLTDIFVLPSYREGIPRVLLEAASMGLPLVTTRAPGCVEVVHDGENGFLVPPRDPRALAEAIGKLIEQPLLRQRFGHASREMAVRKFSLALIAEQTMALYRQLLAKKQGGSDGVMEG